MVTAGRIRKNSMRSRMFRSFDGHVLQLQAKSEPPARRMAKYMRDSAIKLYSGGDKSRPVAFLRAGTLNAPYGPGDYKRVQ
jgi:hypothetical protein